LYAGVAKLCSEVDLPNASCKIKMTCVRSSVGNSSYVSTSGASPRSFLRRVENSSRIAIALLTVNRSLLPIQRRLSHTNANPQQVPDGAHVQTILLDPASANILDSKS